uniref:Uncharacterized protein n=1 Tax=Avena sativa TaxID=4498 RepID=A0ACD5VMV3_AVESA
MLSHFPYLSELSLHKCHRVSGLGVAAKEKPGMATPASTSANKLEEAETSLQQQKTGGDEEMDPTTDEDLVLLPPHIQTLHIYDCPQLRHVSTSIGKGPSAGRGLQDLRSLQSFKIISCPMLLSSNLSFYFLLPASLQNLSLNGTLTSSTLPPLPNLTSLSIANERDLRGEDFLPLLSRGQITELTTRGSRKFFVGLEPARLYGIRTVRTEDVAGFFVMPICSLLSSSLTNLFLQNNSGRKRFTKTQEKALQMLTSLQVLEFYCYDKLQSGPAGLSGLVSLKRLNFVKCKVLKWLPNDSIPSSLEELTITYCPKLRSLPMGALRKCSLRELVVYEVDKELAKRCGKLKGTIPIFRDKVFD